MKAILVVFLVMLVSTSSKAQFFQEAREFTRQDTLRGSITPERSWWDLTYYHLNIEVNLEDSTISGSNTIRYRVDSTSINVMQIDLQVQMFIGGFETHLFCKVM